MTGFGALAVVSVFVGLLVNQWRLQPLPLVYKSPREKLLDLAIAMRSADPRAAQAAPAGRAREIGLDEFQPFVAARKGLIVDARPSFLFREGHVPGAINLSRGEFDTDCRRLGLSLQHGQAQPIAVYCSDEGCHDSELVAAGLSTLGYAHLMVYKAGWAEWSQAGLPQEK